jgi:CheY-like chemotaxis protein
MEKKALIHCVDDEPVNLAIMQELLEDRYTLTTADSSEGCLRQVEARIPDLILLDVNMPDTDGLETCKRLKQDPETADIPIIFVSALTSQEELMAGYEAGGDDYITKPFSEEILQKKIEVVLASQRRKQELKQMSDQAVAALISNLGTTGVLGVLVDFLHRCQSARSFGELAKNLFDCLGEFELDGSLLVVDGNRSRAWFSDDIDRPMERQILESLRGQDRVLGFGTRLAVNSDHATVLVRNLPVDAAAVERLRGLLAMLVEGLDARIQAIKSQALMDGRREALSRALDASRDSLGRFVALHRRQRSRAGEILDSMHGKLEKRLDKLDLTASRRASLLRIAADTGAKLETLCGEGEELDDAVREIIEDLDRALHEQVAGGGEEGR